MDHPKDRVEGVDSKCCPLKLDPRVLFMRSVRLGAATSVIFPAISSNLFNLFWMVAMTFVAKDDGVALDSTSGKPVCLKAFTMSVFTAATGVMGTAPWAAESSKSPQLSIDAVYGVDVLYYMEDIWKIYLYIYIYIANSWKSVWDENIFIKLN